MCALKFRVGNAAVSKMFRGTTRNIYPVNTSIITNHINDITASLLSNKNASTDRLIYSSQDPYYNGIGQFTRNQTCWINNISNISCFSPAQLSGSTWYQRAGTLVTKKHVIFAKHYLPSIITGGTPLIFVDNNDNVVRRNLVAIQSDPITDISVGVLNEEIPNNIKIAKILPTNYQEYIGYSNNFLVVALDQQEKALLKAWTGLLNYTVTGGSYQYINVVNVDYSYVNPAFAMYASFSEDAISGDSGNPIFIIIDNELVLLGCWHTPWSGPFMTNRYSIVNSLIETLSPNQGYSLSTVDLDTVYKKYY